MQEPTEGKDDILNLAHIGSLMGWAAGVKLQLRYQAEGGRTLSAGEAYS